MGSLFGKKKPEQQGPTGAAAWREMAGQIEQSWVRNPLTMPTRTTGAIAKSSSAVYERR